MTADEIAVEIGRNIRRYRQQAGMSQRDLASMLDVTQAAVAHWENGVRYQSGPLLVTIAQALGINPMRLIAII